MQEIKLSKSFTYSIGPVVKVDRKDFREESIYFAMVARFYDGEPSNNRYCRADDNSGNRANNDHPWRGDFKGLIEKLDYIKALGFTAVWITPVVQNRSDYDFHGYHAWDFNKIDARLETPGATYQDLINEMHKRGMKIVQDIVLNHTGPTGAAGPADISTNTNFSTDEYHKFYLKNWEDYTCQSGSIHSDCPDLDTENANVQEKLRNYYYKYIDMGVDAFRIDTVKHMSRYVFNKAFIPQFQERGGEKFYMFGEVCTRVNEIWNKGVAPLSTPFYTWKESEDYGIPNADAAKKSYDNAGNPDKQPTSNNHLLIGNDYRKLDYSMKSDLNVIDFPMHWNFGTAGGAFGIATQNNNDKYYADATWNVVYVDSHDYGPNTDNRYGGGSAAWAENLNLMYTFRGIPCVYYGTEVEFKAGARADIGTTGPLSTTGRAYFGDYIEGSVSGVKDFGVWENATGAMKETLNHSVAKHIQTLSQIRNAVPALRKGQYSLEGVNGHMAYKKRYTNKDAGIDSYCLVTISGTATFKNILAGTYTDLVTGSVIKVPEGGTLTATCSGQGNMRVYVLNGSGKVGNGSNFLK
jgi:glycosidase